jgi:xylan 1,4-beta-xylosidase
VWIEDFLVWCAARELPVDFISTHLYPTDFAFGANGDAVSLTRYADATPDDLRLLRRLIGESAYPDAEVHITEWSSSPSSRDHIHDTVFAATYITRAYLHSTGLAHSISYWTFTDIFEEGGAGLGPFHGGFGLVNEQGIHKPTFHAFAMLNRLGDRLIASTARGVVSLHSATGKLAALFYNYPDDMNGRSVGSRNSYEATRDLIGIGAEQHVRHTIGGLEPGAVFAVEILAPGHGDAAEAWSAIGQPLNLSRAEAAYLREQGDALQRQTLVASESGALEIDLVLAPWAVASVYAL